MNIDKSGWKLTKLGDLASDINKRIENPSDSVHDRFVGLEHFVSGDLKIKSWNSTEGLVSATKEFEAGDILFARRNAYLKRASMVDFSGVCSGDAFVLRENHEKVVPGFISFVVNSEPLWTYANSNAAGTMSKRVKWRDLANYEFLLPPKDQQAKLAELLWAADAVVQRNAQLKNSLKTNSVYLRKNFYNKLRDSSKECGLFEAGKWSTGGTPSKRNSDYWDNGNLLWVTPKDIKSDRISDTELKITEKALEERRTKQYDSGSFVVVWRSGILKHTLPICKIEGSSFTVNQDMKVFEPNADIRSEYARHYLDAFSEDIRRKCVKEGTTVQSINTSEFNNYSIPVPNLSEQDRVVSDCASLEQATDDAERQESETRALLKSLINEIFSQPA